MKKRQFFLILVTLLFLVVTIGGTLTAHAVLTRSTAVSNTVLSGNAALYLTGTRVIPMVPVSASPANCDPHRIPTPAHSLIFAGSDIPPTIKPHLCSIPTFTEQDVLRYVSTIGRFSAFRIEQVSPHFIVTRVLFVTNKVANTVLNADTGVTDDSLIVCYVEVYGDFIVASPFARGKSKPAILHHGQMVFDGITGRTLVMGVQP